MTGVESKQRLVVLASGFGSNLQAIIVSCATGELSAEVVAIVSDHREAYALDRARLAGIPALYHPWKPYKEEGSDRRTYDANLAELVIDYRPTLVILAGWMRILTSAFLDRFPMQVINLHPALPGMFPGTQAIERAWDQFQKGEITYTGVMVHYVPDEGVDDGPVILHEKVPIHPSDTLEGLEERIHEVEHRLLLRAIEKVLKNGSID
jgi:formyltetrahydrofolate-dependent phosphoribosylglycinamide formyltransferase